MDHGQTVGVSKTATSLSRNLISFNAGALPAVDEGDVGNPLPTRLLACPWGETMTNKGRIICNETTVSELPQNQILTKYDRVAFDFQHNTVKAKPGDEPIKIAGYGTPEVVPGEGIYLSAIEYTPDGLEALPKKGYPDLSPTISVNDDDEIIWMHSLAAVRQGEIDGLMLFEAGDCSAVTLNALKVLGAEVAPDYQGLMIDFLNDLGADLDGGADHHDIAAAVVLLREDSMKTTDSPTSPTTPETKALSAEGDEKYKALEARMNALEADGLDGKRKTLIDGATRAGKVLPFSAERLKTVDLETLEDVIANTEATLPMESRTPEHIAEPESFSADGGLSAADLAIAKMLGNDPAKVKQYGNG